MINSVFMGHLFPFEIYVDVDFKSIKASFTHWLKFTENRSLAVSHAIKALEKQF